MIPTTFTSNDAAAITGVNLKTLHYWDKIGLVRPSRRRGAGRGSRKLYDFRDLVAIDASLKLRRAGLYGQGLKRVVGYIRRRPGMRRLPASVCVSTDGRSVRESLATQVGQAEGFRDFRFFVALSELVRDLDHRVRTYAAADGTAPARRRQRT